MLAAHPEIKLALMFGSVAAGRARPENHVDAAMQAVKSFDVALRLHGPADAVGGTSP